MVVDLKNPEAKYPAISDSDLKRLSARIRPLKVENGELHYIKPGNPRNSSFPWRDAAEKAEGLKPFAVIRTFHQYAASVLFKPTEDEVLAQIPKKHLSDTVAYLTIVPTDSQHCFSEGGEYHAARTVLFKRGEGKDRSTEEYAIDIIRKLKEGAWDAAYVEIAVPPTDVTTEDIWETFDKGAKKLMSTTGLLRKGEYFSNDDLQFVMFDEKGGLEGSRKLA